MDTTALENIPIGTTIRLHLSDGDLPMPHPTDLAGGPLEALLFEAPKPTDYHPDPRTRRKRSPKPAHAYEQKQWVEQSLINARIKLGRTSSATKRAQMRKIIAKREKQLSMGHYREAVA